MPACFNIAKQCQIFSWIKLKRSNHFHADKVCLYICSVGDAYNLSCRRPVGRVGKSDEKDEIFQSYVEVTLNTIEGNVGSLTERVSKLESIVATSGTDNDSNAREHVQNETIELEKKVEELIGRANEVVGIIDEQRSTIEDGIMVTIRALHSSWSDWSAWSDCSQSCGKGKRSRYRSCDVLPPFTDGVCIGNDTDKEECVIQECPGEYVMVTDA
ncbi:AGRB2-like protein [Mya arenaria]|uniref:AGRB2-like protein n=1 Tax=Mya arenaria TaxID=6604 RepID=A0ABY7F4N0_MYAAR|nr:AGRB2-like protein [Mya arenaria]